MSYDGGNLGRKELGDQFRQTGRPRCGERFGAVAAWKRGAQLVRDGLASAAPESVRASGRSIEVVRLQIACFSPFGLPQVSRRCTVDGRVHRRTLMNISLAINKLNQSLSSTTADVRGHLWTQHIPFSGNLRVKAERGQEGFAVAIGGRDRGEAAAVMD